MSSKSTANKIDTVAQLPTRDFEHSLPMLLLRAREAVMACFRPLLARYDLSEQQWRIIRTLFQNDGLEISELARRCCILLPSMSGILKRMQSRDLVCRNINDKDQRRVLISLTETGRELMAQVAPHSEARYAEIEQCIGKPGLQTLYTKLTELEQALIEINKK